MNKISIDMATTSSKKRTDYHNEAVNLIIKRSGMTKKEIQDIAIREFCYNNLNLLTQAEKQKYKGWIL